MDESKLPTEKSALVKRVFALFVLVLLAIATAILIERSPRSREERAAKELREKVERELAARYAEAPTVVHGLGGTVLGVFGATIQLDTEDPADYLPHTDGSPRKRVVRFATVTKGTKIVRFREVELLPEGVATTPPTPMRLSDVKVGALVRILSDANLLTAIEFNATEVRIITNE